MKNCKKANYFVICCIFPIFSPLIDIWVRIFFSVFNLWSIRKWDLSITCIEFIAVQTCNWYIAYTTVLSHSITDTLSCRLLLTHFKFYLTCLNNTIIFTCWNKWKNDVFSGIDELSLLWFTTWIRIMFDSPLSEINLISPSISYIVSKNEINSSLESLTECRKKYWNGLKFVLKMFSRPKC
jgi:hypothetical protein